RLTNGVAAQYMGGASPLPAPGPEITEPPSLEIGGHANQVGQKVGGFAKRPDDGRMTVAQFLDRLEQEVPPLRLRFAALHDQGEQAEAVIAGLAELGREADALGSHLRDEQLAAEVRIRMVADEAAANLLHALVDLLADIETECEERWS